MGNLLRRVTVMCTIILAIGWVVYELGSRNALAAPAAQEAPQPAPAPPTEIDDGDMGVVDGRVGSVRFPDFSLSVYARKPTGSIQARNPFFYEVWPVIEYPSSTIYDANSNRLVFNLNIDKAVDPAILERAKLEVATTIGEGSPEAVTLLPLELEAYELFLTQGSVKELVAKGDPSDGPFGPMIAVSAQINDLTLREALAKDPSSLSLTLRPFYRFKVFDIQQARSEISQKVASATMENVLGLTPPGKILVTRDVLNKISQETVTSVRRQIPAGASPSLLDSLKELEQRFSELPTLSVADLASAQETLYYQAGSAQLEIQPDVLHELTTNWSSSEAFKDSFAKAWNTIHEQATESTSVEEFYSQLHEQHKGGGGGGFEFFEIGANGNINWDLTWDEQSSEKRSDFEKFYEKAQDEGTISEETLRDISEAWTGERDYTKVTAKDLKIYRVSNADLQYQLSLVTQELTELPNVLDSRTRTLKLISPDTVVNDAVFVDSQGNVGIGTTSPQNILDVNGRVTLRPGDSPNDGAGLYFNGMGDQTETAKAFVGMAGNDFLRLWGSPLGANGLVMNVNNGHVGIGTVNSSAHLAVAGPGNQSIDIFSTDSDRNAHTSILAVTSNGTSESQFQFNNLLSFVAPLNGNTIMSLNQDGTVSIPGSAVVAGHTTLNGGLTVTGEIRGKLQYTGEYTVDSNQRTVQMIHSSEGFCFLTSVKGSVDYDSRSASVYIDDTDGYWYLYAGIKDVWAGARCAGVN